VLLAAAVLACGPTAGGGAVTVVINSPGSGSSVVVGEQVVIDSTASASSGIARVELAVNGVVERRDTPPSGSPATFRVSQPWTPSSAGQVTISVVAFDVNGVSSNAATITLQVAESGGVVPTSSPGATAVPGGPTETPPPPVTTEAGCSLDSQYVADVTIPDGTVMGLGASFVKTWRVKNSGTCDWDAGFQLLYVSGDQMSGPASVSLPAVPAGGQTDISVNLTAPGSYGTHKGTWRIRSDTGTLFGTNLIVIISIPAPATETPVPTDVPTGEPTIDPTDEPTVMPTLYVVLTATLASWTDRAYADVGIAAGGTGYATAVCPSGTVVGGGFQAGSEVVVYSHGRAGNGWRAYGRNNGGSTKILRVYATCLHRLGTVSSSQVQYSTPAPAGGVGIAMVTCPAGTLVTGGGWQVGSNGAVKVGLSKQSGNGWQVIGSNTSGSSKQVTAYATCLSGVSGTTTTKTKVKIVGGGGTGTAVVKCASGDLVTGGGFRIEEGLMAHTTVPYTDGTDEWQTYAKNTAGSDRELDGFAVCLSLD
jgi:hypothetical protein